MTKWHTISEQKPTVWYDLKPRAIVETNYVRRVRESSQTAEWNSWPTRAKVTASLAYGLGIGAAKISYRPQSEEKNVLHPDEMRER